MPDNNILIVLYNHNLKVCFFQKQSKDYDT